MANQTSAVGRLYPFAQKALMAASSMKRKFRCASIKARMWPKAAVQSGAVNVCFGEI